MATKAVEWQGGAKLTSVLNNLAGRLGKGGAVQVGFFPDARYTSVHPTRGTPRKALPVAQVAFWNNFGTSRTPARPFFTIAVKSQQGHWGRDLADFAKVTNYDSKRMLGLMGKSIQEDVVHMIVVWSQPPNSARTVSVKHFQKPLIDDGTMQRSVTFQVKGL